VNGTGQSIEVVSNNEINTGNPAILSFMWESKTRFYYNFMANSEYVLAAELSGPVKFLLFL